MNDKKLYFVSNGDYKRKYIRADNEEEAKEIFDSEHIFPNIEVIEVFDTVYQVYFSDNPHDPACFTGSKAEVTKKAKLYIRQWALDATIDRIVKL